jgi:hypothetical protein
MSLVARKSTLLLDVSISLVARGLFLPSADNISLDCRQIFLAESLFRISFFSWLIRVVGFLLFRTWWWVCCSFFACHTIRVFLFLVCDTSRLYL